MVPVHMSCYNSQFVCFFLLPANSIYEAQIFKNGWDHPKILVFFCFFFGYFSFKISLGGGGQGLRA